MNKPLIAVLGGLAAGFGGGYLFAELRLRKQFEARIEKETADMAVFYSSVTHKKYATPEEAVAALVPETERKVLPLQVGEDGRKNYHKILEERKYAKPVEEEKVVVETNVFGKGMEEMATLHEQVHQITEAEFEEAEKDYIQQEFTWYRPDDKLADINEELHDNADELLGPHFRKWFEDAPEADTKMIFVRNNYLELDFAVSLSTEPFEDEYYSPIERPADRIRREG